MDSDKKVKQMYWEDNAFIIETEDGEIIKYIGAYVKDVKYEFDNEGVVEDLLEIIKYSKKGFLG